MDIINYKSINQLNPLNGQISDTDLMIIKPNNRDEACREAFGNIKQKILDSVPQIPTNVSELTNDAGYLTSQDITNKADKATTLAGYEITDAYTKTEVDTAVNAKADSATSLAGYGITDAYNKTEVDNKIDLVDAKIAAIGNPLVWIASKTPAEIDALPSSTKPGSTYTVSQDGNIGNLAVKEGDEVAWNGTEWFVVGHTKFVPTNPDWTQSDSTKSDYIKNKPSDLGDFTNNEGYIKANDIANKADKSTSLEGYGITDAYNKTTIDNKLEAKADSVHSHAINNISGLNNALDGKANKATSLEGYGITNAYTKTEVDTSLSGKASSSHNHSMSDVSGLSNALSGKSDTGHTHQMSDVSGLDTALSGKAPSIHRHTAADISDLNIPTVGFEADGSHLDSELIDLNGIKHSFLTKHQNIPAQVQSDWNEADTDAAGFIKNKPQIPAAQIQSDWNQTNQSALDYIKNKPTITKYKAGTNISFSDSDGWVVINYDGGGY